LVYLLKLNFCFFFLPAFFCKAKKSGGQKKAAQVKISFFTIFCFKKFQLNLLLSLLFCSKLRKGEEQMQRNFVLFFRKDFQFFLAKQRPPLFVRIGKRIFP
jgi:hypothetical protein